MSKSYRFAVQVLILTLGPHLAHSQVDQVQSDWSGGAGVQGPVVSWEDRYNDGTGVSAVAIPGQLVLGGVARTTALQTIVQADAGNPNAIAAGDLDGDGLDEFVVSEPVTDVYNNLGAVWYWTQSSPGVWEQVLVSGDFYGAHYVDTADVDSDGDVDIVAAAYYGLVPPPPPPSESRNGRFAWFENLDGQGGAWSQHLVGEYFWGANWIDAGDMDGDGDIDLVGASELTDGIYEQDADLVWFENLNVVGTMWAQHDLDVNYENASEAHLVDLDGDSDIDIVAANLPSFGSTNFYWWENDNGDGTSWTKNQIPYSFQGSGLLDVGDIDGDGDIDLIGTGLNTGALGFWENLDGSGDNWFATTIGTLVRGKVVKVGDIDGDGDLDAIAASAQDPQWSGLWWYENLDGVGASWGFHQLDALASRGAWLDLGDANGDGKLDAVVSCEDFFLQLTEQISWWDLSTFEPFGQLTSSILDGVQPQWGAMYWDATTGPQSSLVVEVRASDDPGDLGTFVQVPGSGSPLASLIDPGSRFLQYRLTLTSSNAEESPMVREIGVDTGFVAELFTDGFESGDFSSWSSAVP